MPPAGPRPQIPGFGGQVIVPGDPGYESAREVENARFDRHPGLVARPLDGADVARAIAFARETGLPIAVRAGGHSTAGHSTGDGVVVIDLSSMRAIDIDTPGRTAWVDGGVLAGTLTRAAFDSGLAIPFGDTGSVGVAGITLGGGIGWLVRKHGLTIDSLLEMELVTADGRQLRASEDEHPDLFWALRGGSGNFGVVTRLRYRLHPIGDVLTGSILLPATSEVFGGLVPTLLAAPDELTAMPNVMAAPPDPAIPPEMQGKLVVYVEVLWSGPIGEGAAALAPLRALGPVINDTVGPRPYPEVYGGGTDDGGEGTGERWAAAFRTLFVDHLDGTVLDVVERWLAEPMAADALAQLRVLGGELARVPADATAFAWRDRPALLWLINPYRDVAEGDQREASTHSVWSQLQELGGRRPGAYVNFMGDEGAGAVAAAYPPETLARLRRVKRTYDPDNVFQSNFNIAPA